MQVESRLAKTSPDQATVVTGGFGGIIKKDRFKMASGFRLDEVCILSGCSILLRECIMIVEIKALPVYGVSTMLSMYLIRVEYIIKKVSVCTVRSRRLPTAMEYY